MSTESTQETPGQAETPAEEPVAEAPAQGEPMGEEEPVANTSRGEEPTAKEDMTCVHPSCVDPLIPKGEHYFSSEMGPMHLECSHKSIPLKR